MTTRTHEPPSSAPPRATTLTFVVLAALTALELNVSVLRDMADPMRVTVLAGLLLAKVGLVLVFCLRAELRRRSAARLTLIALVAAGLFAAVLMLEAAFQARTR
jgi:heme/copper-type cytochrome/quinol oxidase subunit 4